MRVLAVTHSLGSNGAALCLYRLLVAIKNAGGTADVLYNGNEIYAHQLREHGIGIIDQVQAKEYDVALVNTLFDHHWVNHIAPLLPVVFWVHEGGSSVANEISYAKGWIEAFKRCSRLVFDCEFQAKTTYRTFLERIEPHRILHVEPGVAIPPALRGKLNYDKPGRNIVTVGSVYPRKRPADLVNAMLRIADTGVHCHIVGNLQWIDLNGQAMQDSIANNPHLFTLHGETTESQKLQHLRDAHVFCSASSDETFGIAAVEAASMGLPLALSDLPCYEGIWKHGVNALLAPLGAIDCISWNLMALTQDKPLANRLREAAMKTARRFTLDRFVQRMTDVLVQAIQDPL